MSEKAPSPAPSTSTKRILVVDDNTDLAQALGEALELAGHTVHVTTDAVRALELAGEVVPDVFILDIELPVMDGYELARRLRMQPRLSHSVLIALTGYGQAHDRRQSSESGFQHHLVKPVDLDRLLKIVREPAP
jgi:CheY-like chemotaxis protein